MEGRRGLSRAGRGLGEENFASANSPIDGGDQLFLDRAGSRMGKRQVSRGFRFAGACDRLGLPDSQQTEKAAFDLPIEPIVVVGDRERDFFSGRDVDVDEGTGDAEMAEAAPQIAVAEKLLPVAFKRMSRKAEAFGRKVRRLELFDQPGAFRPLDASIEASRQGRSPLFDRNPRLKVDFATVGRMRLPAGGKDARVELGPDAESPPAVSPVESDATETLVLGELADGELERPARLVEPQEKETTVESRRKNRTDPL